MLSCRDRRRFSVAPRKLIAILQQNGMLNRTEARRSAAFEQLLARLYLHNN